MRPIATAEAIAEYSTINPLLLSMYDELKAFALKKQDGSLSKLKVSAINQILERANKLLANDGFSEFLQMLDTDTLPSNSDAVMIVANYKTAMSSYYTKYTNTDGFGGRVWRREELAKKTKDNQTKA